MATRRYQGAVHRLLTAHDVQGLLHGGPPIQVADPFKVDAELTEIFSDIDLGAPLTTGSNHNVTGSHVLVTTPSTAGAELAVLHGLTVAPQAVWSVCPLSTGGKQVGVGFSRTPDTRYAYVTFPETGDAGKVTLLYFLVG